MKNAIGGLLLGILGTLSVQFFYPNCNLSKLNCSSQDSTQMATDSLPKNLSDSTLPVTDTVFIPADSTK